MTTKFARSNQIPPNNGVINESRRHSISSAYTQLAATAAVLCIQLQLLLLLAAAAGDQSQQPAVLNSLLSATPV